MKVRPLGVDSAILDDSLVTDTRGLENILDSTGKCSLDLRLLEQIGRAHV